MDEANAWIDTWALGLEYYDAATLPKDRKWLVRSALQKSIRRGQTEPALRLALALRRIDADYVWKALATIAVEDVGFGCPEAVTLSSFGTLKSFRDRLDADRLLSALVVGMCVAEKSRTCCELSTIGDLAHAACIEKMANLETLALWQHVRGRSLINA